MHLHDIAGGFHWGPKWMIYIVYISLYWKIRLNNMDNLELPPIWDIFQISTCTLTQVSHLPGLPRLHRLCQILREVPGDRRSQSIFDATCAIHGLIVLNFIYYIYMYIYIRYVYNCILYILYTKLYTHMVGLGGATSAARHRRGLKFSPWSWPNWSKALQLAHGLGTLT
jgi:hypothetical protein